MHHLPIRSDAQKTDINLASAFPRKRVASEGVHLEGHAASTFARAPSKLQRGQKRRYSKKTYLWCPRTPAKDVLPSNQVGELLQRVPLDF